MRILLFSILSLLQVGVFQAPSCSVGNSEGESVRTANRICARGWKSADNQHFRFCVPDSFEELRSQSADTEVWKFGNEEITVKVEYGSHVTLIKRRSGGYNADEIGEKLVVDGRHGLVRKFVLHQDEIDWDPTLKDRIFVTELYIDNVHGSLSKLQMTVFVRSELEQKVATTMFESIEFTGAE